MILCELGHLLNVALRQHSLQVLLLVLSDALALLFLRLDDVDGTWDILTSEIAKDTFSHLVNRYGGHGLGQEASILLDLTALTGGIKLKLEFSLKSTVGVSEKFIENLGEFNLHLF